MKVKGKAVPLQAWSGPEGSRKLRFSDFMTTAQDGGKVVSLTHRPPLSPGNTPGTQHGETVKFVRNDFPSPLRQNTITLYTQLRKYTT